MPPTSIASGQQLLPIPPSLNITTSSDSHITFYPSTQFHLDTMAFSGASMMRSKWAQEQQSHRPDHPYTQHHNQAQQHMHHNHYLNPSTPSFQPTSMELQPYEFSGAPLPTPPRSGHKAAAVSAELAQMQRYITYTHFDHTKDVVTLERKVKANSQAIETVKGAACNDIRLLQDEIQELKGVMSRQQQESGALTRSPRADMIGPPSDDFKARFSKEVIAEHYCTEADDCEKMAARLREEANVLCGITPAVSAVEKRLLAFEVPKGSDGQDLVKVEFACCGEKFGTAQDLLTHFGRTHGVAEETKVDSVLAGVTGLRQPRGNVAETPTHVPVRRTKVDKETTAVEIIKPEVAKEEVPKTDEVHAASIELKKIDEDISSAIAEVASTAPLPRAPTATTPPAEKWIPLAVRQMPDTINVPLFSGSQDEPEAIECFTRDFLIENLGGNQWSPGFFFVSGATKLLSKSYWLLESTHEPFLPANPGEHGAKLTAFFKDAEHDSAEAPGEENYVKAPVFVHRDGWPAYVYYGSYSQTRFSDKLDQERVMTDVPEQVRHFWAEQLADAGRPQWVTEALMEHFWPKPQYGGPLPNDSALASAVTGGGETSSALEKKVRKKLDIHALMLKDWRKEAEMKVKLLTTEALMKAFSKADADEEPGLRLWWEYLECVEYDQGFYDYLIALKRSPGLQRKPEVVPTGPVRKSVPAVGGKMVKPGVKGAETVKPAPASVASTNSTVKRSRPRVTTTTSAASKPALVKTHLTKKHTGAQSAAKPQSNTTPAAAPTTENNEPQILQHGDMELAKEMQSTFTKAGPAKREGRGKAAGW